MNKLFIIPFGVLFLSAYSFNILHFRDTVEQEREIMKTEVYCEAQHPGIRVITVNNKQVMCHCGQPAIAVRVIDGKITGECEEHHQENLQ